MILMSLGFATLSNAQKALSDVPEEAIAEFQASFVFENGNFRGANIAPLIPYMGEGRIISIIKDIAGQYYADDSDIKILMDRKPIYRGCKPKKKWVCIISGGTVIY